MIVLALVVGSCPRPHPYDSRDVKRNAPFCGYVSLSAANGAARTCSADSADLFESVIEEIEQVIEGSGSSNESSGDWSEDGSEDSEDESDDSQDEPRQEVVKTALRQAA